MKFRGIAWQIVAGVLILILAGAGAVPAKAVCQDGCTCHRQTRIRDDAHPPDHGTSHGIHGAYLADLNPFHHILIDPSTQHPACRTVPVEICRMTGTRPMGVLQRAASGTVQTAHPFSGFAAPVLCQTIESDRFFPGGDSVRRPSFDPPLVPLYLQHLSFLC